VFKHAADVRRDFGTAHFVVNNAGATVVGTVEHLSIEEIEWQLGINLWGPIYGTKAFLPMMLKQREGCIVNISSVFGLVGFRLQSAYNISKFGVRGLTECLWSELEGTGVRAVCVTGRHPHQHREIGPPRQGVRQGRVGLRRLGREDADHAAEQCAADILAGSRAASGDPDRQHVVHAVRPQPVHAGHVPGADPGAG